MRVRRYLAVPFLGLCLVVIGFVVPAGAATPNGANDTFVCNLTGVTPASGTYRDVIVPPNGFCLLNGATVTHDVIAQENSLLAVANTTIGHDLVGNAPQELATGAYAGTPGHVSVGHDVSISGSDGTGPNGPNAIGYDVCDTGIQHDLSISQTLTFDEIAVGDIGTPGELCSGAVNPPDSVGHDVAVTNNQPARVDIGNNTVGHDLVVSHNTATGDDGGRAFIDVSDNHVGQDASCSSNNPSPSKDGPEDGPNSVGHTNTCG